MAKEDTDLPAEDFEYEDTSISEDDDRETTPRNLGVELNGLFFGEDEDEGGNEDGDNDDPPASVATLEQLQAQNAQLAEQVKGLSGQFNGYQQVQAGINELGERIGRDAGRTAPQKPGESDEDFKKRINESLYEDPYANLEAWGQRRFGPVVQQMMDRNLQMQRQIMRLDPEKGKFFAKYEKEIDKELSNLPPQMRYNDPDVLTKVYKNVVAVHLDDIVEERVKAQIEGQDQDQNQGRNTQQPGHTAPYSATSQGQQRQTRPVGKAAKIPDYVKDFALKRGMHESDAYAFMKENNLLRRAK